MESPFNSKNKSGVTVRDPYRMVLIDVMSICICFMDTASDTAFFICSFRSVRSCRVAQLTNVKTKYINIRRFLFILLSY